MGKQGRWTDGAILRESARWVHVPSGGIAVEDEWRLLVHLPGHQRTSRVWRSWPDPDDAEALIRATVEEVREAGGTRLVWHTGDGVSPPFLDELLEACGFVMTEDLEVLAFDLADDLEAKLPQLAVPRSVRVRLVTDAAALGEAHRIESRVFPASAPDEPDTDGYLRGLSGLCRKNHAVSYKEARTFVLRFLASIEDPTRDNGRREIATAGAEVVDETVRLWGAGTLVTDRGRGAYRALVAGRCRTAHVLGATLALTKANTSTSASALRRAGFRAVAAERRYAKEIQAPDAN